MNKIFFPTAALLLMLFSFTPRLAVSAEPGLFATFHTSKGNIVCKLFEKRAPKTVRNFIALALGRKPFIESGSKRKKIMRPFYNETIFHKTIPDSIIEGGDRSESGKGGPGFFIEEEISPSLLFNKAGRLAMVRNDLLISGSLFFITAKPFKHLNGINPIFGQVVEGMDVVKAISSVATNLQDKPDKKVFIKNVSIRRN